MSVRDCIEQTRDGASWCWTHDQPYAECDGEDSDDLASRARWHAGRAQEVMAEYDGRRPNIAFLAILAKVASVHANLALYYQREAEMQSGPSSSRR